MPILEEVLATVVTNLIGLTLGIVLIIGAWKRWSWFVAPPESAWPMYSVSLVKKFLGGRPAIMFSYIVGALIALVAGIQLVGALRALGHGLGYWE